MSANPSKASMNSATKMSRVEVEDFLIGETALLDAFKLDEWLGLFLPDAQYLVPSLDRPNDTEQESLYLVADDMRRLKSRVHQFKGRAMWVENPPSRTRHMLSNVRIVEVTPEHIHVTANFVVYRIRNEVVDPYIGHYEHLLVPVDGSFRFKERKAVLDLEALRPFGKVSIIL
jgi:p-cumate 2,3-dioxygenase subunit beta